MNIPETIYLYICDYDEHGKESIYPLRFAKSLEELPENQNKKQIWEYKLSAGKMLVVKRELVG